MASLSPLTPRGKRRVRHVGFEPLMTIRPANPALALTVAKVALEKQDAALFDRLPSEVDDYTYAGWLSVDGQRLLDADGNVIGKPRAGDSFVSLRPEA